MFQSFPQIIATAAFLLQIVALAQTAPLPADQKAFDDLGVLSGLGMSKSIMTTEGKKIYSWDNLHQYTEVVRNEALLQGLAKVVPSASTDAISDYANYQPYLLKALNKAKISLSVGQPLYFPGFPQLIHTYEAGLWMSTPAFRVPTVSTDHLLWANRYTPHDPSGSNRIRPDEFQLVWVEKLSVKTDRNHYLVIRFDGSLPENIDPAGETSATLSNMTPQASNLIQFQGNARTYIPNARRLDRATVVEVNPGTDYTLAIEMAYLRMFEVLVSRGEYKADQKLDKPFFNPFTFFVQYRVGQRGPTVLSRELSKISEEANQQLMSGVDHFAEKNFTQIKALLK